MNRMQAVLTAAAFMLISGLVTAIIPNPIFIRMVEITWLDYFFWIATSLLLIPALSYNCETCAVGGSLGGLVAFSCPICNKILLLWGLAPFLMEYRYYIGALSLLLLAAIIFKNHLKKR